MLRIDIKHNGTLKAIDNYKITDNELEKIKDIEELRKLLISYSRRKWREENRDYYKQRYSMVKNGNYEKGSVNYNKNITEPKQLISKKPNYVKEYNREYYQKRKDKITKANLEMDKS
jgi:hypothetical protein